MMSGHPIVDVILSHGCDNRCHSCRAETCLAAPPHAAQREAPHCRHRRGRNGQSTRALEQRTSWPCATSITTMPPKRSRGTRKPMSTRIFVKCWKEKGIDAVVIATPDHTHAVISMEAMRRGKHVYCQKPLTHNVYEARMLAKAARETGVTTQMGIQGHSDEGIRLISEWIWDGAIGEVHEVDAWCSLSYYPFGHAYWSSKWSRRPADTPPVPATLNWDLWLGPAPKRPYHPAYHPGVWRCWWDFGCGMMGDRGAHTLDPVVFALKLGHPVSVEATSLDLNPDTHPIASIVTYNFGARGTCSRQVDVVRRFAHPGLRSWRDGRRMGHTEGGVLFKGTRGKLAGGVYGASPADPRKCHEGVHTTGQDHPAGGGFPRTGLGGPVRAASNKVPILSIPHY